MDSYNSLEPMLGSYGVCNNHRPNGEASCQECAHAFMGNDPYDAWEFTHGEWKRKK
jgi:hypothetical protein